MKTQGYAVDPDASVGDVDLDREVIRRRDGSRITETDAQHQVDRITRQRGRPSLTGQGDRSPQITTRVSPALQGRIKAKAAAEGKKPSEIIREALEKLRLMPHPGTVRA